MFFDPFALDVALESFRDRVDQVSLFLQERSLVGLGHLFLVGDLDRAHSIAVDGDVGRLAPLGLLEPSRLEHQAIHPDSPTRDLGVLPAGRHEVRGPLNHFRKRKLRSFGQSGDPVQAVQLLDPFPEIARAISQGVIDTLALGDVAEGHDDGLVPLVKKRRHPNLDVERGAVLAQVHRFGVEAVAESRVGDRACHERAKGAADEIRHVLADQLVLRVSVGLARSRIRIENLAVESDQAEHVRGRLKETSVLPLAFLQTMNHRRSDPQENQRPQRNKHERDGAGQESRPDERRLDFGQVDLGHDAEFGVRHRLMGGEHPFPAIIQTDDGARCPRKSTAHRLGMIGGKSHRLGVLEVGVPVTQQEDDPVVLEPGKGEFAGFSESPKSSVPIANLIERRRKGLIVGRPFAEVRNLFLLVPEHRLEQSRPALSGFDETFLLLLERRTVQDEQLDTGHARHDQRHDQNQHEHPQSAAHRCRTPFSLVLRSERCTTSIPVPEMKQ